MSKIKRVVLIFISCIILSLVIVCPLSASSLSLYREDFLSFGYKESSEGYLYLEPGDIDYLSMMQPLIVSEKNYPSFDPNNIPWDKAPSYIQDIINSDLTDFQNTDFNFSTDQYKVPFICVRVNGTNAIVYAGYNLAVFYISSVDRLAIGSVNPVNYSIQQSYIYRATYRISDMALIEPWANYSSVNRQSWFVNDNVPTFYTYTNALTTSSGRYDLYFYGASSVYRNNVAIINYGDYSDDYAVVSVNMPLGFQSGNYFFNPSSYLNTFCGYFKPSIYGSVDSGIVDDYNSAEKDLINGYNPDDLSGDLDISIDNNAWSVIFNIFSVFITGNTAIMTLVITILSLGFIALILNR